MPRQKVYDDELHAHFITFSCDGRRHLLGDDQCKKIAISILDDQLKNRCGKCAGFVIMPNHIHSIIWFPQPGNISEFVQQWKRLCSFQIKQLYRDKLIRYAQHLDPSLPIWLPRFYDFNIFSQDDMLEKLKYIHENPVKAGLAGTAAEWKYSSARWYEMHQPVGVDIDPLI